MTLAALTSWVIQTGLMVSLLIIVILLIRRPFARTFGANAAYALWSLPLIRLFLPGLELPRSWVPSAFKPTGVDASRFEFPVEDATAPASLPQALGQVDAPMSVLPSVGVILAGIWIGVACVWLIYQLIQQSHFKSNLIAQSSIPGLDVRAEIELASTQVRLKKTPNVRLSTDTIGPLVTGVMNPLVILPHDFALKFDKEQRNFALVHEFAHIKRGDLWVALLTLFFRALNWPNPLVHFASHKLRSDQEAACDAFVVKITGGETAHSYAQTLVKAVRETGESSQAHSHLALSLIEPKNKISKGD